MTTKSIYFESLQGDVRKRYHEKTSLINGDPYMMAKREVSKDREWQDITCAYVMFQLKKYHGINPKSAQSMATILQLVLTSCTISQLSPIWSLYYREEFLQSPATIPTKLR